MKVLIDSKRYLYILHPSCQLDFHDNVVNLCYDDLSWIIILYEKFS